MNDISSAKKERGRIVKLNRAKQYGFIRPEKQAPVGITPDVYFREYQLEGDESDWDPVVGDMVEYEVRWSPKGPRALHISLISAALVRDTVRDLAEKAAEWEGEGE